jgi:hypothetical protein
VVPVDDDGDGEGDGDEEEEVGEEDDAELIGSMSSKQEPAKTSEERSTRRRKKEEKRMTVFDLVAACSCSLFPDSQHGGVDVTDDNRRGRCGFAEKNNSLECYETDHRRRK